MSCLIPSLAPPDLYISLRGVFSSTNPHLQLHTNDTNCQCNYVLICAVCVSVRVAERCVLHASLSGVINRCRGGFAGCTRAVCFCFRLFAESLSEMLTDFHSRSRFISVPDIDAPLFRLLIGIFQIRADVFSHPRSLQRRLHGVHTAPPNMERVHFLTLLITVTFQRAADVAQEQLVNGDKPVS